MIAAGPAEAPDAAPLMARLARDALAARPRAGDGALTARAKLCLLDFIGNAFAASDLPWSAQARAIASRVPDGAFVLASDLRTAPADAAFVHGVMGHGLVRDDMHAGAVCHLGVVIWPTLLALSAQRRCTGRDLLEAAVLGYEVGGRLGRALVTPELARLFRPTGLVGPIAGALAGARLLGMNARTATHAAALAANCSGGLNQWPGDGASEMYFHPGFAARSAVACLGLAAHGAVGAAGILDGEAGLFRAFARRAAPREITLFPDGAAEIEALYFKPAPACNFAQTACQAALAAARQLGGPTGSIARVSIRVPDAAMRYPGCDHAGPFATPLQAKMSIQFGVAATIARGGIGEANFAAPDAPDIGRLLSLTHLAVDDGYTAAFPARQAASVEIECADGRVLRAALDDVEPATPAEVRARFGAEVAARLGAARMGEVEAFVDALDAQADAALLGRLCAPGGDHDR